jgi:2-polyprenyl-3-methyl-5-hydroxy-6-metoxy-1,4-benzoquinol methylase
MNFDEAAPTWDTPLRRERAAVLASQIRNAWEGRPESVLDFGCGSGLIAFELRAHAGMVYGYDASREMGRVFQEKREALQVDNVRFLTEGEMRSLCYDVIVSSMVLHHIGDVEAEIAALKRLLKPGGRLVWIDLDAEDGSFHAEEPGFQGHNGFDRDEVKRILTDVGFPEVGLRTVFQGEKQVNGRAVPYTLFMAVAG